MWSSQRTSGQNGRRVDAACRGRFGFFFRLFVFRFLLRGFFKFVDERFLFLFALGAFGDVALAVEIDAAIDQGLLHNGVRAQRVVIVNRQVGVFSNINRANALVDAELHRGIQRDHLQRLVV